METSKVSLKIIHTGNFKLDGGAMFGVVPKVIWNRLNPADDNNLCNWAMRCLLVEVADRKILIDTGIGNKQSEKFYSFYDLNGGYSLESSLEQAGVSPEQITDILLTHLHFDHCGGAIKRIENNELALAFPNATHYVTKTQWDHANNPNPREKASFLKENFELLLTSNKLAFVSEGDKIADVIEILEFNGHTMGMICPLIHLSDSNTVFYGADLFPSSNHLPPNYVMGYDIQPLITMAERERINRLAIENQWIYVYEHDVNMEASRVGLNEKGQFTPVNAGKLSSLLG